MVASSNIRSEADRVSIITEFDLITQRREDYSGEEVLDLPDEDAGRWIKDLIRDSIELAKSDARVLF